MIEKYSQTIVKFEELLNKRLAEANKKIENSLKLLKDQKDNSKEIEPKNVRKIKGKNLWIPREAYIHKTWSHKNGIAVMKSKNKIIKIPLICKWIYN